MRGPSLERARAITEEVIADMFTRSYCSYDIETHRWTGTIPIDGDWLLDLVHQRRLSRHDKLLIDIAIRKDGIHIATLLRIETEAKYQGIFADFHPAILPDRHLSFLTRLLEQIRATRNRLDLAAEIASGEEGDKVRDILAGFLD